MKYARIITLFLGVSMLAFGCLKFTDPFKTWYAIQVANSGLGNTSYRMGIFGEIAVGFIFIAASLPAKRRPLNQRKRAVLFASTGVIVMMTAGIYVHLHPLVPAEVLPLKIKPPYIPGFFLALALTNIFLTLRNPGAAK
jgi:predicted permease